MCKISKNNTALLLFICLFCFFYSLSIQAKSRLTIVIDDVGYRQKEDMAILAMPKEIAIAIIPSAPYAKQRNKQAQDYGHDILIHMPMQPMSNIAIESGGLKVGMSEFEIAQRVKQAKSIVSNAIGMNNHMGSRATADQSLMTALMKQLHNHRLAFLDSKTIGSSVAIKTAKNQNVKALERHIFLDDSNELADVRHQFQLAIHYARKHGTAVVIGHPRPNTVKVLQQGLAQLPADIQLVSISSLWGLGKETSEEISSYQPPKPFILLFNGYPILTYTTPYQCISIQKSTY